MSGLLHSPARRTNRSSTPGAVTEPTSSIGLTGDGGPLASSVRHMAVGRTRARSPNVRKHRDINDLDPRRRWHFAEA
jgi:hypothetical protein